MKAKDVAKSINQAATEAGLDERWAELKKKLVSSEPEEQVKAFSLEVLRQAQDVTDKPSREYMNYLTKDLGTRLKASSENKGSRETLRALVLAADQAWRAFHHRLNEASGYVVEADALKNGLRSRFAGVYTLGWDN